MDCWQEQCHRRSPAPCSSRFNGGLNVSLLRSCVLALNAELANILSCCQADPAYKQVLDAFYQGRHLSDLPVDHPARHLRQVWDHISLSDDSIMLVDGDKLYLPPGARSDTLRRLHEGH